MSNVCHRIYISLLVITVILVTVILAINGSDYYLTPLYERHAHAKYDSLKPTGTLGHGIGIAGSFLIITGVFGYMARKRFRRLSRIGLLKHWLEFHIFLCSLGPILILFHTSFKFGGIIAISFWSMVIVVISGIIGRYIYLQIPRTIEGRELTMNELTKMEQNLGSILNNDIGTHAEIFPLLKIGPETLQSINHRSHLISLFRHIFYKRKLIRQMSRKLKETKIPGRQSRRIMRIFKSKITLSRRIYYLTVMQKLFRYWHVAHLPFAMTMFVIMMIHIAVAILFGYIWIF
jgi:hypothetical protein